jgi:multiple sugar transport system substrate-binding protein
MKRKLTVTKRALLSVGFISGLTIVLSGCGSGGAGNSQNRTNTNQAATTGGTSGTTITVLLPPWGQMPQSSLAQFTKSTGIKVNLETMSWDGIHQKIVTSEAAHVSPADVTEFDWSWVGQFGQAGWYTPLNTYVSSNALKNNLAASIFTVNGNLLAMPYSLDYRVFILNMTDFKKAGINTVPNTWAEVIADAKQIKAKGVVKYPIALPMSVTEGSSTPWYELIKSVHGELFSQNWTPQFVNPSSAGAQALQFEKELYDQKLVPPGEVSLTDVQNGDLFKAGQAAILVDGGPGGMAAYFDPKTSKISKDNIMMMAPPGNTAGQSGTFGLPEGLGIPTLSTHKAAAAEFINWWMQTPQQTTAYENANMGDLPTEKYALQQLTDDKKLVDGQDIMKSISSIKPLFPQGTPSWYPQFSNAVGTMIQAVIEGKQQIGPALQSLAQQAKSFQTGS